MPFISEQNNTQSIKKSIREAKSYKKINLAIITIFIVFAFNSNCSAQQNKVDSLLPKGVEGLTKNQKNFDPGVIEIIPSQEKPPGKAIRVNLPNDGTINTNFVLSTRIANGVKKNDVLWLAFESRCVYSSRETGEALIQVALNRTVDGKNEWPPLLERSISINSGWAQTQIPFIANRDIAPGELTLILNFGSVSQSVEIGSLSLLNYRQTKNYGELPRSVVHYDGDDPEATWRKAAATRIQKIRKGILIVKVINRRGRELQYAKVAVRMKKSTFSWGTAANSKRLLDSASSDSKKYRDTLLRYFNKVVFENELKWKYWDQNDHAKTIKAAKWLHQNGLAARGHVMVWPSWQHSPKWLANLKSDTAALNTAIVKNIREQASTMKGQFNEWDIVNEPYAHHDLLDLLGRPSMADWFKEARKDLPGVKLFLNDYTMFQGSGTGSPSEGFYNNVKFLQERAAPIDAIGEQGHIGGIPPGIPYIISRLDHFAKLGLPIQISEFDITSDDEDYKARYMRDFMTAIFSHPATMGLIQWGFWEKEHWIRSAALWDKDWNLRPNGKVFTELVGHKWSTNVSGYTNKKGGFTVNAFNGSYEIKVIYKGKTTIKETSLSSDGKLLVIKIDNE
jgi:endo-1,4-beta-xylanase